MTSVAPLRPLWKTNAVVITFLILIFLAYYYWQIRQATQAFSSHVQDHVQMVAGAIRMNADRALLSRETIEEILTTFLGSSARFVDYLDAVEPFSDDELAAFAREAGLLGIRVERAAGVAQGPAGWFPAEAEAVECTENRLRHFAGHHLYLFSAPATRGGGCIRVALADRRLAELQQRIGLDALIEQISRLAGIRYIHFAPIVEADKADTAPPEAIPQVRFEGSGENKTARATMRLGRNLLVVGVEASHFSIRMTQLRHEFLAFTVVIVALGLLFSWLLNGFQRAHIDAVQRFEQRLAREKEDAALGRASATITHEIRNPLNAISMGLQRLRMEAAELTPQHQALLDSLGQAVRRTDTIVGELKRYTRPLSPRHQPVEPGTLVEQILILYRETCAANGIAVTGSAHDAGSLVGDPDLLAEVFENLIKNAVEAQPQGGDLQISAWRTQEQAVVRMENGGFSKGEDVARRLMEPYFTTKTRGSGLGLAIAQRIVQAHGGTITLTQVPPERLRIDVALPLLKPRPAASADA